MGRGRIHGQGPLTPLPLPLSLPPGLSTRHPRGGGADAHPGLCGAVLSVKLYLEEEGRTQSSEFGDLSSSPHSELLSCVSLDAFLDLPEPSSLAGGGTFSVWTSPGAQLRTCIEYTVKSSTEAPGPLQAYGLLLFRTREGGAWKQENQELPETRH